MRSRTRRCGCRTPDLGVLHSPRVPPHARRATDAFSILQRVLPRCSHPSEPPLRRPAARWQMPLEASAPRPRGPCFRPGRRAARLRTSVAAGRTLAASLFSPWHCARPASLRPLRACCSLPCSRQGRQPLRPHRPRISAAAGRAPAASLRHPAGLPAPCAGSRAPARLLPRVLLAGGAASAPASDRARCVLDVRPRVPALRAPCCARATCCALLIRTRCSCPT